MSGYRDAPRVDFRDRADVNDVYAFAPTTGESNVNQSGADEALLIADVLIYRLDPAGGELTSGRPGWTADAGAEIELSTPRIGLGQLSHSSPADFDPAGDNAGIGGDPFSILDGDCIL